MVIIFYIHRTRMSVYYILKTVLLKLASFIRKEKLQPVSGDFRTLYFVLLNSVLYFVKHSFLYSVMV